MDAGVDIGDRTRKRLTDFLKSLPPAQAHRLAEAVEEARRSGDSGLPHDLILDALAPVLQEPEEDAGAGPAPDILFMRPFEDLLVDTAIARGPGRIARRSVAPVWDWLSVDLSPGLAQEAFAGPDARTRLDGFYRECARALGEALGGGARHDDLAVRLGGQEVVEDARKMAAILEIASEAVELRDRLPEAMRMPGDRELNVLVCLLDGFTDRHPGRVADFFLVLAARMEKPWEVLEVMHRIRGRAGSGRPDAEDVDAVRARLFEDMEADAEFFRTLNTRNFDPALVAEALSSFTRAVTGLSRAAGVSSDGRWSRRMMTSRSLVAEKMEILMERVPRDILSALPIHKIGRFGRVRRRPDISSPPDDARAEQALRMAHLADACRAYAADAAFKVSFSEAMADTREGLNDYAVALLDEMKRTDAEFPAAGRAYLDLVIKLTALAIGPEQAGRLRRDAAALGAMDLPDAAVS